MTKRIMRAFKMSEISGVDRPAQAAARAVIMKRSDEPIEKDMYQVARFAELISSLGCLLQSSIYERDNENDGSRVPDQLREWLAQGTPIFQAMSKEEIDELLSYVRKQNDEVDAYLKRDYWSEREAVEKRTFTADERKKDAQSGAALPDGSFPIENESDLKNAMRAIGRAKDPAKAKAHIRSRAKALGLSDKLSDAFKRDEDERGILQKIWDLLSKGASPAEGDGPVSPEDAMTPALKKALGLPENATEQDCLNAIAKQNVETIVAKMSQDERKHYDALKADDEKEKFRAKSKEDREKEMKDKEEKDKAEKAADPVLRKLETENDDLKKRLAALEEKDQTVAFAKRAVELGLPEAQGETLRKALAGDKPSIEKVFTMLGSATKALEEGNLLKELGTSLGGGAQSDDPIAQLTAKAEELRKSDPKLTREEAFAKVYSDPANAELARAERRANRPQ